MSKKKIDREKINENISKIKDVKNNIEFILQDVYGVTSYDIEDNLSSCIEDLNNAILSLRIVVNVDKG